MCCLRHFSSSQPFLLLRPALLDQQDENASSKKTEEPTGCVNVNNCDRDEKTPCSEPKKDFYLLYYEGVSETEKVDENWRGDYLSNRQERGWGKGTE